MHQIRYFLAVAKTLNFTRAAEECNVAQPSLTRAIKNLEAELGGELFRRERASSHLTNLGRSMLPMLTQSFESAAAAKLQADSFKQGTSSTIRITLSYTADFDLVADALGELENSFGGVQLYCQRGSSEEILAGLRCGEAELALASSIDETWDRLDSWPLFVEDFCVFVRNDHRFAKMTSIDLDDLSGEPMIARPYCEKWSECRALLEAKKIEICQPYEVTSDRDTIRLIEAGLGIGILPSSSRVGKNIHKAVLTNQIGRTIQIYTVAGRQRSPVLFGLMNLLRSADWGQYENLPAH